MDKLVPLGVASASATFEQGSLKVRNYLRQQPCLRLGGLGGQAHRSRPCGRLSSEEKHRGAQGSRIGGHLEIQFASQASQPGAFPFLLHGQLQTPTLKSDRGWLDGRSSSTPPEKRSPSDKKTILEAFAAQDESLSALRKKQSELEAKVKKTQRLLPKSHGHGRHAETPADLHARERSL